MPDLTQRWLISLQILWHQTMIQYCTRLWLVILQEHCWNTIHTMPKFEIRLALSSKQYSSHLWNLQMDQSWSYVAVKIIALQVLIKHKSDSPWVSAIFSADLRAFLSCFDTPRVFSSAFLFLEFCLKATDTTEILLLFDAEEQSVFSSFCLVRGVFLALRASISWWRCRLSTFKCGIFALFRICNIDNESQRNCCQKCTQNKC